MKKKLPWPVLLVLILLSPIILFFTWRAVWNLDPLNMFPAEPASEGYVETVYSRQLVEYQDLDIRPIYVYLIKENRWYGECYFSISVKYDNGEIIDGPTIRAQAGDEFEFEGYHIRVLRVFPWSPAVFVDGYFMGDVTLEIFKLDSALP